MDNEPTVTVSVARKVTDGQYGSAEAFVSVSGLRAGATAEEIDELLETGKLAWSRLLPHLRAQIEKTLGTR